MRSAMTGARSATALANAPPFWSGASCGNRPVYLDVTGTDNVTRSRTKREVSFIGGQKTGDGARCQLSYREPDTVILQMAAEKWHGSLRRICGGRSVNLRRLDVRMHLAGAEGHHSGAFAAH